MAPRSLFVLDSNVLIDYCAADRSMLTLVSRHVGIIHVPSVLLEEIGEDLDESECERLGIVVVEPEVELLVAAGKRRPGLSYYDHVCLLAAKQNRWTCVTNDGRLRRECRSEQIPILWGLEIMFPLVADGHLTRNAARSVARAIAAANPVFITTEIIARFDARVEALKIARRPPRSR